MSRISKATKNQLKKLIIEKLPTEEEKVVLSTMDLAEEVARSWYLVAEVLEEMIAQGAPIDKINLGRNKKKLKFVWRKKT